MEGIYHQCLIEELKHRENKFSHKDGSSYNIQRKAIECRF
ncbi:hypothetical protein [Elizabethkingia anophelis]